MAAVVSGAPTWIDSVENKDEMTRRILTMFGELSQIPRGSYKLDGVRSWLRKFASANGVEIREDKHNVVLTLRAAVEEKKKKKALIIQSHMDMVQDKAPTSTHNFDTDPIKIVAEGDILRADGTTLGADNGLSLVSSLVMMQEIIRQKLKLEADVHCLCTADEETGLTGAKEIDPAPFLPEHAYCLNVDSEVQNEVCAASCGGSVWRMTFECKEMILPSGDWISCTVCVNQLQGGHSGIDIGKGRGNAIKILAQFLTTACDDGSVIVTDMQGGRAHNAIAIGCEAKIALRRSVKDRLLRELADCQVEMRRHYQDPNITCTLGSETELKSGPVQDCSPLVMALLLIPQGPSHNDPRNPVCVETSNNIGMVTRKSKSEVEIEGLGRSFTVTGMRLQHMTLSGIAKLCHAEISPFSCYTGWMPDWSTSTLLKALSDVHMSRFGKKNVVYSVHAGLETTELLKTYPKWDCMSIGPQINQAHTYNEHALISSISPFFHWMFGTMQMLCCAS